MPVWLARARSFPAVEEAKQLLSIVPVRFQAGVSSYKIILLQGIGLLLEVFRCEDEVIGDYGEFVEYEEVGWRQVRNK
jgi:hypothetical protein